MANKKKKYSKLQKRASRSKPSVEHEELPEFDLTATKKMQEAAEARQKKLAAYKVKNDRKAQRLKEAKAAAKARYEAAHPGGRYSFEEFQQMNKQPQHSLWQESDFRNDWPFPGADPNHVPNVKVAERQNDCSLPITKYTLDMIRYRMWRYIEIEAEARIQLARTKDAMLDLDTAFLSGEQRTADLQAIARCDRAVAEWREAWKTAAKYKDTHGIKTSIWMNTLEEVRKDWLDASKPAPTMPKPPSAAIDCDECDNDHGETFE